MPVAARSLENLKPWQPGQSPNPAGRPRGARSKLSESVIAKLLADFEAHGTTVIERVRTHQPAAYLAACVSLLPKQQEKIESPFADLSDEELELLEAFLRSTRAKTVTTIDADATHLPSGDAEPIAEPQSPPARAAAVKVDPTTLSDEEIEQRLQNALNSSKRELK